VGKSTLFNRLIGGRDAIVDARPGVTRDRHFGAAEWNGRRFWLVDTGGMVPGAHDQLNRAIRAQVEAAVAGSDVVLFLVDVEAGLHPRIWRSRSICAQPAARYPGRQQSRPAAPGHTPPHFLRARPGRSLPVSAAIGKSSGDLLDRIVELLPAAQETSDEARFTSRSWVGPTWGSRVW